MMKMFDKYDSKNKTINSNDSRENSSVKFLRRPSRELETQTRGHFPLLFPQLLFNFSSSRLKAKNLSVTILFLKKKE